MGASQRSTKTLSKSYVYCLSWLFLIRLSQSYVYCLCGCVVGLLSILPIEGFRLSIVYWFLRSCFLPCFFVCMHDSLSLLFPSVVHPSYSELFSKAQVISVSSDLDLPESSSSHHHRLRHLFFTTTMFIINIIVIIIVVVIFYFW